MQLRWFVWLSLLWVAALGAPAGAGTSPSSASVAIGDLVGRIPARSDRSPTGSQFAASVARLEGEVRERAILKEVLDGNVPSFLRRLVPVRLTAATAATGISAATIFVMPDYLAIGSDDDFLRIPMNLETANAIAARFGFVLPTRKIVDAIFRQAAYRFVPEPLSPGPEMRSTDYYQRHNDLIDRQARLRGIPIGAFVSGHKKDVVVTNLLSRLHDRLAIYGWHRPDGTPIQPLSLVHGVCYADYSHGVRLVSETVVEQGVVGSLRALLQNVRLAGAVSDEGALRPAVLGAFAGEEGPCAARLKPASFQPQ